MNCSSCGANLPPGAAACPLCGTPITYPPDRAPYNVAGPGSSPQFDPTVAARPYGTPPSPSTEYGAPSYGPPPPPIQPSQYPYAAPPPNQYGGPAQQSGYVQPGYLPPGQGGYGGGMQPPPKPRSRVGMIIGIVIGVVALLCIAGFVALYVIGKNSANTLNATATTIAATVTAEAVTPTTANTTPTTSGVTPTTVGQGTPPSGLVIDPTAASYVINPQMSSAVDSNYHPTAPTTTFTTSQTIYATFKISASAPDGYVEAKWYSDGKFGFVSKKPLAVKGDYVGYLAAQYFTSTQGAVEYYFCIKSDCSDAKLADVTNFTVTSTSMQGKGLPGVSLLDINRPE
jgi:hypothetical protein